MKHIMMRESSSKEVQPIPSALFDSQLNDLAVTFSKNGEALSIFSDDIWDYSATSNILKTINFRSRIQKSIENNSIDNKKIDLAVKFLKIFALHWICEINGCSMTKFSSDLVALSFLIGYCVNNDIEQHHIFTEPNAIEFLITSNTSERQIGLCLARINRIINTASVLNQNKFWINLQPSEEFLIKLKKARLSFPETTDVFQTMVIPSRIYQALLKDSIEILRIFNEFLDELEYIFSTRIKIRDTTLKIEKNAPMAI